MQREWGAEFIGTFMLVSAVCGAALFSAPSAGLVAVAFAVGLAVLAMVFAVGYIVAQLLGGAAAAAVFYVILKGAPAGKWNDFVAISNLYGGDKHFSLASVFIIETVMTALFLVVITGTTSKNCPAGFAPIAIGLALTVIHLVAIPVSNASVNPARSTATAIFGGGEALSSLWLFWVAPILGGVIGGLLSRWLQDEMPTVSNEPRR